MNIHDIIEGFMDIAEGLIYICRNFFGRSDDA